MRRCGRYNRAGIDGRVLRRLRAFVGLCAWPAGLAGSRPGGRLTFLATPKKSKQKKATPTVCVPTLRFGQPALLTKRGRYANSAAPQTRVSLIPVLLRCSAHTEGEIRVAKSNSQTSELHKYAPWRVLSWSCFGWFDIFHFKRIRARSMSSRTHLTLGVATIRTGSTVHLGVAGATCSR
jgi:hypothetical protein